jgi:DNA-binding NarL/FixJ family response regulator
MGTTLDGFEHLAGYQRDCYQQSRQVLGEQAFLAARTRGMELPPEDAITYALQAPATKPPDTPPAPAVLAASGPAVPQTGAAPLTSRELQVAHLIALGRSNKEIAAQLVIAQRTAEGHVECILTKLGFTSRAPGRRLGGRVPARR